MKQSLSDPVVATGTVLDPCKAKVFFLWHVKRDWRFIHVDYVVKIVAVSLSLLNNKVMEVVDP